MPRKYLFRAILLVFVLLIVGTYAAQDTIEGAAASILNTSGEEIGQVTFTQIDDGKIRVEAEISTLEPGFHGFHIHGVGMCEHAPERPFSSAAGHLNLGDEARSHQYHSGDMPSLLVTEDGTAVAMFVTDRFTVADLLDEDGSAVIIHADADNFANIPERYGEADETTLNTGDAGGRVGCGVINSVN